MIISQANRTPVVFTPGSTPQEELKRKKEEVINYVSSLPIGYVEQQLSEETLNNSDLIHYDPVLLKLGWTFKAGTTLRSVGEHIFSNLMRLGTIYFRKFEFGTDLRMIDAYGLRTKPQGQWDINDTFETVHYRRKKLYKIGGGSLDKNKLNDPHMVSFNKVIEIWISDYTLDGWSGNSQIVNDWERMSWLYVTPRFALEVMCRFFMPSDMFEYLSKTEAAMITALVTGVVVNSKDDPTYDRAKWNAIVYVNSIVKEKLYNIYTGTFISERVPNLPNPDIVGIYNFLSDTRIIELVPLMIRENKYMKDLYSYSHPEVRDFLRTCGINFSLYEYSDFDIKDTVFNSFGYVLHTKLGIPRSPLIPCADVERGIERLDVKDVLYWYSDDELFEYYMPFYEGYRRQGGFGPVKYSSRSFVLTDITNAYDVNSFIWKINYKRIQCSNDNNISLIAGIPRGQDLNNVEKSELLEDPVLSYGPSIEGARRRCFRMSELVASFTAALDDPETADFFDPDYIEPGRNTRLVIDPLTERPITKVFSTRSMVDLSEELLSGRVPPETRNLVAEFRQARDRIVALRYPDGLLVAGGKFHSGDELKQIVANNPKWRNDLLIFFGWMFMFSMWMRFWKGPGYQFNIESKSSTSDRCIPMHRDEHITIELNVYGGLMLDIERDNKPLSVFINSLPLISNEWDSGNSVVGTILIVNLINDVQKGKACMGFAGDSTLSTAYVYLTKVLNVPEDRIRDLLTYVVKLLRNRELRVINERLNALQNALLTDNREREIILNSIQAANDHKKLFSDESTPALPPVQFTNVGYNLHVL